MNTSLQRNLYALYVVRVAKWMNLVMPVIVLFYQSNGLTMQDIFTLKAVYSATLMVLEIPTGYFADRMGRRISILAGSVFGFAGFLLYASAPGFWVFILAEVILGVGMSLVSGADSAMLYDTLLAGGQAAKYTRYEGRITAVGNYSEALAGIAGGLLAVVSLQTPFLFQSGIAFIAVPAALMLKEPPVHEEVRHPRAAELFALVATLIRRNRKLLITILFSSVCGLMTLTMAWFAQPFFIRTGMPVAWFGVAWALLNLTVGMSSYHAWRIENRLGSVTIIILFTVVLVLGFPFLAFPGMAAGLAILVGFYLARGLATPLLRNYINLQTTSEVRATVLSVRNFLIRGSFALLGPLTGWVTDRFGLVMALLLSGLLFSLAALPLMALMLKSRAFEKG